MENVRSEKANMKAKLPAALGFFAAAGLVVSQTIPPPQTCAINTSSTFQTIDGFGAASAFADPVSMTSAQAATLFGRNNGQIGLSLWRIRIDPNENWSTETTNAAFAHQWGARVLGTPWTPPASMKSNTNTIGGTLNSNQYAAYASYLNLAANSIGLDYVSMQNEPDANVSYESCFWNGTNMENWCASNAPAVGRPLVMPESESFDYSFSDPTLSNSTAASHVSIIAGHIYGGFPLAGPYTNALVHGKHVWMTEHYNDNPPTTNITTAVYSAWEISECMNEQMSAYIWWRAYHPALAIDDLINGTTPIVTGYMVAQFANFIRPGYVMVGATFNPSTNVFVTAYTGGGALVVVAVNMNSLPVTQGFSISGMSVSSMIPTVTSSNLSMAQVPGIPVKSGIFDATLPALSTATFVSVSSPILVNARQANGAFQFSFTGSAPLQYTVLTATNLTLGNWTVAGSATNTGSNNYAFSAPLAAGQPARFYRVQLP